MSDVYIENQRYCTVAMHELAIDHVVQMVAKDKRS